MSDKMEKWELQELVDEAVALGQIRPLPKNVILMTPTRS